MKNVVIAIVAAYVLLSAALSTVMNIEGQFRQGSWMVQHRMPLIAVEIDTTSRDGLIGIGILNPLSSEFDDWIIYKWVEA